MLQKETLELVYNFINPTAPAVPILVSVPHCGIEFPPEIAGDYDSALTRKPDDTDWYVDRLYDFAPSMGMTMITARYSRWVIDLNRTPDSTPLYTDGRIITDLCPATTFLGEPLYLDNRKVVVREEVQRRIDAYYKPYHERIADEIERMKRKFGAVLLWDCHSIRQIVPTIQAARFPDLILGDVDGTSASGPLIDAALSQLGSSNYKLAHNHPFKGGYISRSFGKPSERVHALQLEMVKLNYMNDDELEYHEVRAAQMRGLLMQAFRSLIPAIQALGI